MKTTAPYRARPSNGRRGEAPAGDKKKAVSDKVSISTGLDVYNCLTRKMMTVLLLFGDADIGAQKFDSNQRGGAVTVMVTVR